MSAKGDEELLMSKALVDFADENSEYWNAEVDGRAFLMLVDRLGDRLGGGIEAMKRHQPNRSEWVPVSESASTRMSSCM